MLVLLSLALLAAADPAQSPNKVESGEAASDPQDKMVCKRFLETGSLVKGYRVCKTKREWQADRDAARDRTGPGTGCANAGNGGTCG